MPAPSKKRAISAGDSTGAQARLPGNRCGDLRGDVRGQGEDHLLPRPHGGQQQAGGQQNVPVGEFGRAAGAGAAPWE